MKKNGRILGILGLTLAISMALPSIPSYADTGYYELQSEIELPDGGYNINRDYIGIKVIKTNLALLDSSSARYTSSTEAAVRKFQLANDLTVSGEVDLETWLKMGYTEDEWYDLGTYTHPILTTKYSSRADIINAMLITAKEHADEGTIYRVGASGFAGSYADCSGLIFQCLYAAGINPEKNIVDHALQVYEYTSRNLEADERLGDKVSVSDLEPGDLIFYHSNGIVVHVGIYDEKGLMYDSWPQIGVTHRAYTKGGKVLSVRRVLPKYDETLPEIPANAITALNMPAGDDSMVLCSNAGFEVKKKAGQIAVVVDKDGVVKRLSISDDLVVEEDECIVAATGSHADWVLENVRSGMIFSVEDSLSYVTEPVKEEPIAEEPATEEPEKEAPAQDKTEASVNTSKLELNGVNIPKFTLKKFSLFK